TFTNCWPVHSTRPSLKTTTLYAGHVPKHIVRWSVASTFGATWLASVGLAAGSAKATPETRHIKSAIRMAAQYVAEPVTTPPNLQTGSRAPLSERRGALGPADFSLDSRSLRAPLRSERGIRIPGVERGVVPACPGEWFLGGQRLNHIPNAAIQQPMITLYQLKGCPFALR